MATSLNLDRLNDEARDWFYLNAEASSHLERGPDLQWWLDRDGNFQIWTTEHLTPGREEYCVPDLRHDYDVLQSIWFSDECFQLAKQSFLADGIKPAHNSAYYSYLACKKSGPLDRSTVNTRRYAGYASILIISAKTESFCAKIPDHLVKSFAAAQTETEENVTYLSHFINTVATQPAFGRVPFSTPGGMCASPPLTRTVDDLAREGLAFSLLRAFTKVVVFSFYPTGADDGLRSATHEEDGTQRLDEGDDIVHLKENEASIPA